MHGVAEFYCPHAGCSRAEGGRKPFTRKENRADHLRRQHKAQDTISVTPNRPIIASSGAKGKGKAVGTEETEASGETALLWASIQQLQRQVEQLKEGRSS